MSIKNLIYKFKYHYKKYLAIAFIFISVILAVGEIISDFVILGLGYYQIDLNFIWNIFVKAFLVYVFVDIFKGNKENSSVAFRGVVIYASTIIISQIFSLSINIILSGSSFLIYLQNKEYLSLTLLIFRYAFLALEIGFGIVAYTRMRQYFSNQNVSATRVKVLFIIFFSFVVLSYIPSVYFLIILLANSSYYFLSSLFIIFSLNEFFAAIACIFTILRISD